MSDVPTPADLGAIRARADAATPGPWGVAPWSPFVVMPAAWLANGRALVKAPWTLIQAHVSADAQFVAHARTDIPVLLARVAELEADRALPVVAHKGPNDTDEKMFLRAARNLEQGYPLGGGNLTQAVIELIRRQGTRAAVPSVPAETPEGDQ